MRLPGDHHSIPGCLINLQMFCTSIIPTIGRKALKRAVKSLLEQRLSNDTFEVLVVNDSGSSLPEEEWHDSPFVRIINTHRLERCVARNTGAALARGQYLHFLDDDDWLLPGALESFWQLSQKYPEKAWLYGGTVIFNRYDQEEIRLVHRLPPNCFVQVMAGEWIPLQASLIKHESFHQVGGFNPLIPGIEDMDLARRMSLRFDFCGTEDLVAGVGMGSAGSTTNQVKARSTGQQVRELILNEPGVYDRLRKSAFSPFWKGRIARIYLTSAAWNLSRRKVFIALSRIAHGFAALLSSALFPLLKRDFWKAVAGPYKSEAFARGFDAKARESARRL